MNSFTTGSSGWENTSPEHYFNEVTVSARNMGISIDEVSDEEVYNYLTNYDYIKVSKKMGNAVKEYQDGNIKEKNILSFDEIRDND